MSQTTALGAALGSIGLGVVAVWSWLKLRAVLYTWDKATCTVIQADDETFILDGDTTWLLRVTFDTPNGKRVVTPGGYNTQDAFNAQRNTYVVGSQHTLYLGPQESDVDLTPPWSKYNPAIPALMSAGFAAAAIGVWMGWIKTGG